MLTWMTKIQYDGNHFHKDLLGIALSKHYSELVSFVYMQCSYICNCVHVSIVHSANIVLLRIELLLTSAHKRYKE